MADIGLILDTHALLWWWGEPDRLSPRGLALLRDPSIRVVVSAASAWEIATKSRLGRLPGAQAIIETWSQRLAEDGFGELAITAEHAFRAGTLPSERRDPFDRMLAAQSLVEGAPVLSSDPALSELGAARMWE
jgi:PIN domain nuclease of toxin-antitoxin system